MNPEELEQRIARTPRNPLPAAWRDEILAAARAEADLHRRARAGTGPGRDAATVAGLFKVVAAALRQSPWSLLAAGWCLVLLLGHAGAWVEPASPRAAGTLAPAAGSGSSVFAAARHYRSEVVALVQPEDLPGVGRAGRDVPVLPAGLPQSDEGRPRGQWVPGRRDHAGRMNRDWS